MLTPYRRQPLTEENSLLTIRVLNNVGDINNGHLIGFPLSQSCLGLENQGGHLTVDLPGQSSDVPEEALRERKIVASLWPFTDAKVWYVLVHVSFLVRCGTLDRSNRVQPSGLLIATYSLYLRCFASHPSTNITRFGSEFIVNSQSLHPASQPVVRPEAPTRITPFTLLNALAPRFKDRIS